MHKVILQRNNAYKWYTHNAVSVKGFLYNQSGNVVKGVELAKYFEQFLYDEIYQKLSEFNGIFTVVIQNKGSVIIAVDRFRTYPIFYRKKNDIYYISDEVDLLFEEGEQKIIQENAVQDFSGFGFTLQADTLLQGVYQTQAGEFLELTKTCEKKFYYEYGARCEEISYNSAKQQLHSILNNLLKKTAVFLKDKQVALPLSGGYDSRLLAIMLKEAGISDVMCFTFGTNKRNPEKERARKVAEKLGLSWHFIDYDTIDKKDFEKTERFKKFYQYESQYVSKFAFMQYFAACYIQDELGVKKGTYIIPGHGGDFFSGSHLRPYMQSYTNLKSIAADLQYIHCDLVDINREIRKRVKKTIKTTLNTVVPLYNNIENWDLRERQAKYIINSCKIWEQFDLPYFMPLCDNEFMDFFVKLPFEYRINQKLYIEVVREIFERYNLNFDDDKKISEPDIKQRIKAYIKRTFPFLRKKADLFQWDYFDFKTTSEPIVQELKEKGVFQKIRSMNGIFTEWYLLRLKD